MKNIKNMATEETNSINYTVCMDKELVHELKNYARDRGHTLKWIWHQAITEYLAKHTNKNDTKE